jgi:hypothetical protein
MATGALRARSSRRARRSARTSPATSRSRSATGAPSRWLSSRTVASRRSSGARTCSERDVVTDRRELASQWATDGVRGPVERQTRRQPGGYRDGRHVEQVGHVGRHLGPARGLRPGRHEPRQAGPGYTEDRRSDETGDRIDRRCDRPDGHPDTSNDSRGHRSNRDARPRIVPKAEGGEHDPVSAARGRGSEQPAREHHHRGEEPGQADSALRTIRRIHRNPSTSRSRPAPSRPAPSEDR